MNIDLHYVTQYSKLLQTRNSNRENYHVKNSPCHSKPYYRNILVAVITISFCSNGKNKTCCGFKKYYYEKTNLEPFEFL